jgi:hypothetical protein
MSCVRVTSDLVDRTFGVCISYIAQKLISCLGGLLRTFAYWAATAGSMCDPIGYRAGQKDSLSRHQNAGTTAIALLPCITYVHGFGSQSKGGTRRPVFVTIRPTYLVYAKWETHKRRGGAMLLGIAGSACVDNPWCLHSNQVCRAAAGKGWANGGRSHN